MTYFHSHKEKTNWTMYQIEQELINLSAKDMLYMKPLAKLVYESKREIDDSLIFWKSNLANNANHHKIIQILTGYFKGHTEYMNTVCDLTLLSDCMLSMIQTEVKKQSFKREKENDMMTFKKSQKDGKVNELIEVLNSRAKGMSEDAIKEIQDVLASMASDKKSGSDYSKNMTFLKACSDLTFGTNNTVDETDMEKVLADLNATHYGMDDAKELMVEFMGVKQLNKDAASPQFIFTGPAGTGKTTLALQIAEALGRKAARVSLGGIGDDAILRGHDRTYMGSKCGRIMNAIIKTGVSNPVIVLDEIDKMDVNGAADAVLLEILDPAQNVGFTDSYFNFAYDLSDVIFIATANYPERIDAPIIDRMETIECSGYTLNEKAKIATKYIIPKTMKEMGLKKGQIKFTAPTVKFLIDSYTREAGMRSLEQAISKILRGAVMQIIKGKKTVSITKKYVEKRMGQIIWDEDDEIDTAIPGTVNGLAVMGGFTGAVIQIESAFSNKLGMRMLGDTGDMMDNSCETVQEFLSNNIDRYGVPEVGDILDAVGIATLLGTISCPSDGDSASITLLTSWVSLLLDRPVNPKVAMTGSISLNGKVRAIGGLDHKVAAGVRAGIETFIISEENRKDYNELSDELKRSATFHIVKHADEVMLHALNVEV